MGTVLQFYVTFDTCLNLKSEDFCAFFNSCHDTSRVQQGQELNQRINIKSNTRRADFVLIKNQLWLDTLNQFC